MLETAVNHRLYEATRRSLQAMPKELPAVWLYDARGSRLYEEITRLPEYYLPRREAEILQARSSSIAKRTKARTLVELGSGSAPNTRFLLDALSGTLERYVPFDVSEQALRDSAEAIAAAYPAISVEPVVGDFERDLGLLPGEGPRLIAFLGSTIGNLYPERRAALLSALAHELGEDDALLLGVDLVKDVARLEAAYDDPSGVTEAFVRNALRVANRELDATFEQERFEYEPLWDPAHEWMDIGLRARVPHVASVRRLGLELDFAGGERLRVEISAKFRREAFELELERAGLSVESWWTEPAGDYAIGLARPRNQNGRRRRV
jgi:L-histidine Nalpha-methyltransferase